MSLIDFAYYVMDLIKDRENKTDKELIESINALIADIDLDN